MMFSNQPMNPQELAALRRRISGTEDALAYSPMPTNIGSGLQRLGTAVGLAAMRARYNSQFPDAPSMPGGGYAPQAKPPIQSILETVSGNRMPWQFPAAPSQPGMASNITAPVMTSPRQGDRQPLPIPASSGTLPSSGISDFRSGASPIASMKSGGLFGLLKPQAPSGLW